MDFRRVLLVAAALAAGPAGAGMLYKSVAPNGSVIFSDMPPEGARVVEAREIRANGSLAGTAANAASRAMAAMEGLFDADSAIARANSDVDLAEHALALARREMWSVRDGLRLQSTGRTIADEARLEFFKRNVRAARQALVELLHERQLAARQ
jgi:uncharacterized protein DUF4124